MYVIWVLVESVAIEGCLRKVRFILANFKRQMELSQSFLPFFTKPIEIIIIIKISTKKASQCLAMLVQEGELLVIQKLVNF